MSEIKHLDLGTTPTSDYQPTAPMTEDQTLTYHAGKTQGTPMPKTTSTLPIVILVIAIVAGVLTGTGAQRLVAASPSSPLNPTSHQPIAEVATGSVKNGDVFGKSDEKTFKDSAEGYLEKNTSEISEGTHRLVRPGGESQTVYMISSVTDLDKFDGMMVKVWGETFKGQKAGWLMDVGRVLIVETAGTPPAEE